MLKQILCLCLTGALLLGTCGIVSAEEADKPASETQEEKTEKEQAAISVEEKEVASLIWNGPVLAVGIGTVYGPTGKETYYNEPPEGLVRIMRGMGFSEEEYPYWVREDGCRMLGDYVMVAANLDAHPRGSLVPCSRGMAIVCDTGAFAVGNPDWLDVAVTW